MTKHLAHRTAARFAKLTSTAAAAALLALVAACPTPPKDKPKPHGGEGEGEGDGVVFDCPTDAHADSLDELAARFSADINPLMTREAGGCIQCHASDSGRLMTMADTPENTFFRIRAGGYFRLVNGMIPERVIHESMPQGGPAWTQDEKDLVLDFACDLASLDDAGIPPDEEFPPELLSPYSGPPITDYDNTFLTYNQLRGRVLSAFDDDWVRLGVDKFSENISLFGGADFVNTFVPARDATPEFFVGLDLLAEDVCLRAATDGTGPFAGLDLDAPIIATPDSTLTTFEAETATIIDDACLPNPGDTTVVLCTSSTVSSQFTAPIGGDYTIVARANGDEAVSATDTDLPHMEVKVDNDVATVFDVPGSGFQNYSITVHVDAGSHNLAVSFTNDCCGSGNDRNLFLDKFSIEGPLPGSTNGSATGPQDAKANLRAIFSRMLLHAPLEDGSADDEVERMYTLMLDLVAFDGSQRGAYSGVCEGLFQHPDFLFTRPSAFDTSTVAADKERLLTIKSAFDLVDRPPNDAELGVLDSGGGRADLVDTWLGSDEFAQAYNTRIRAVLEFDGTPDGDEPSRLWTYVMKNDRPLKEILTADYTVDDATGEKIARDAEHGATGLLTMKGYIKGKPGLPHYNYAARVFTGFMGVVFNVPQEALDARATATASTTVDPDSICYSCHRLLTPLAYQRQKWDDDGNFRTTFEDGRVIDDTDNDLVADYPFKGPGLESFSLVAVRKEGFVRRMANVHYTFAFGRNMRHDQDERDIYLQLWNAVNSGNGTFRDVMKQVLFSRMYTDPNPPTDQGTGGAP